MKDDGRFTPLAAIFSDSGPGDESGVPETCPRCGEQAVVPILYGYPTFEARDAAARREIALGGCIIYSGAPSWVCTNCGLEDVNTTS